MPQNLTQIRFITANYSRLQGLRLVVIGLFVALTGIWTALPAGQDGDLAAPLVLIVVAILAYIGVDRYYARTFGQVTQTAHDRNREIIMSVLFGILALVGVAVDKATALPFSLFGLVFAAAMFEDFWRATEKVRAEALALYPEALITAVIVTLASLFPMVGLEWWQALGPGASTAGMMILIGALGVISGLFGHLRLNRALAGQ